MISEITLGDWRQNKLKPSSFTVYQIIRLLIKMMDCIASPSILTELKSECHIFEVLIDLIELKPQCHIFEDALHHSSRINTISKIFQQYTYRVVQFQAHGCITLQMDR